MPRAPAPLVSCVPAFARHNAFPPRVGWPAKVHAALRESPQALSRPDAATMLGVGSSMVKPMRFWSHSFGLIRYGERLRPRPVYPTARGHWLLDEDGADPYLEDPATLWLLHWWLLSGQPCYVPTFFHLFANWWKSRFTRSELRAAVQRAAVATGWPRPGDALISHDITALTSMYGTTSVVTYSARSVEEYVINPFRQLGILNPVPDSGFTEWPAAVRRDRGSCWCTERGATLRRARSWPTPACNTRSRAGWTSPAPSHWRDCIQTLGAGSAAAGRRALAAHCTGGCRGAPRRRDIALVDSAGGDLLAFDDSPRRIADRLLASYYHCPSGPETHS
ncbi:hypothetical protein SVIO_102700 [Streptomyces violaceusniger]|uniref:DUF4007 domain-containing protein n=1 Tax=Streptomyces violaceusniger TaxID=68280 RepID=A0A4D4LMU3_STRVO|nr:hypothetical protein SVIO_102700 [Streptomyces violaceusniger]